MVNHHTYKLWAAAGVVGEAIALLQSQPVLGFISFVGTVISAASAWYWSEKARKRRDRRDDYLERASERILNAMVEHQTAEIRAGRPDPFPELTKILLDRGDDDGK